MIDTHTIALKMSIEMRETEEEFIFSKILPFCSEKLETHVSKDRLIKALEKQDKYRWHDLRKNPKDLPNNSRPVLVADKKGNVCIRAYYVNPNGYGGWSQDKYDVIAWRAIEPYEEE